MPLQIQILDESWQPGGNCFPPGCNYQDDADDQGVIGKEEKAAFTQALPPVTTPRPKEEQQRETARPEGGGGNK